MNTVPEAERDWLGNSYVRSHISKELRATGQIIKRDVQIMHFPPGFVRLIMQALRSPGKLLSSSVMHGELLGGEDFRLWALLSLCTAISASGLPPSTLSQLTP